MQAVAADISWTVSPATLPGAGLPEGGERIELSVLQSVPGVPPALFTELSK
jgi:hypothetical protein